MPLEFDSEEDFQNAIASVTPQEESIPQTEGAPLQFESEQAFQEQVAPPIQQEEPVALPPGINPNDLASAVLGNAIPQAEAPQQISKKSIIENYGPANNTLAQQLPAGLEEIHPADMEGVTQALSTSFMSMSSTGIILDPMERVMYATSVMENTAVRADVRAQLIDQAMRDGKVLPQALPKSWYEARGMLLLPPDLNIDAIDGEIV